eukprot:8550912-Prorocentrum_lima.AAC.1
MQDNPDYATSERVWRDQKEANKGVEWCNNAGNIAQAKVDIRSEGAEAKRLGTFTHKSHKQQK